MQLDSHLEQRVALVADEIGVPVDRAVMLVALLVEEGDLFVGAAADLSPEAEARVGLARFRSAVPPLADGGDEIQAS